MFSAISESLKTELTAKSLRSNLLAGITVGIIALPLSMALAIASGVPPQNGLYTAIVAGIVISLSGGSRVNISGPTAAFVVLLLPIVHQYGLGGLMISGMLAGFFLVFMGLARLGSLIQIVPYPVVVGFTSGIGTVIATLQIKDFLGLNIESTGAHFIDKLVGIITALPTADWREVMIGAITLATLVLWSKLKSKIPGHIVALMLGTIVSYAASILSNDFQVATIGSRFHYEIGGLTGYGIPQVLPHFMWPWDQPGTDGSPVGISVELLRGLTGPAMAIAILGALESLLCAVVADGMTGKRHNPNDELIGQGLGNIVSPFFGGIPATAAIARTAANIRAGGSSPISSVIHSVTILVSILLISPLLSYIPMSAMAALLIMVAWNMSEAGNFIRIIKLAPREDVITLLTCFSLTVALDMMIAVAVGMGLAGFLFIRRMISLTGIELSDAVEHEHSEKDLSDKIQIYDINGPMFFGTARKALHELTNIQPNIQIVILDMSGVTMMDMTAITAFESIIIDMKQRKIKLVINNLKPRMILMLRKAGLRRKKGNLLFARNMKDAIALAQDML